MSGTGAGDSQDAARLAHAGEIYFEVRGLGLGARDDAIASLCAGDEKLKEVVLLLLRGGEAPMPIEGLADEIRAAAEGGKDEAGGSGGGDRIGNYRLISRIGEGGFGIVYEAEQERPVRRRVALKVIKLGMDTRQVVARFEAERQALALMDHPNIAKVFDAGATPAGRPYFVMELVKGAPATDFCDAEKLGIRDRLEIAATVCDALQHAHQKGVIHRDIKPSNVLVARIDGRISAKVIDFGVAKATSARLTEKTIFTEFRQLIGTPEYMSPEQAGQSADDIDTRTDVYAVGVLLYELLTGATPFDSKRLRSAAYGELLRIIREEDPPKPSTRLSSMGGSLNAVAATRGTAPQRLGTLVRGELDWIVMKAMEKDRSRRYESAGALASDLRRYLVGEAVLAAPPSRGYQLRKFAARNRSLAIGTGAVGLSLLVGVAGFAWQASVARRERDTAESERNRALAAEAETAKRAEELKKVSDFQAKMLAQVDPSAAGRMLTANVEKKFREAVAKENLPQPEQMLKEAGFDWNWKKINATDTARDLIDETILKPAVKAIDTDFKDQPLVDAALRQVIADRYGDLSMYAEAFPLQESALATRRRLLGNDHPETLTSINNMAILLQWWGKLKEAEPYLRECLERKRRVYGDDKEETIIAIANLGSQMLYMGRAAEAEPLYAEGLERSRKLTDKPNQVLINMLGAIGTLKNEQGKFEEAEKYDREALELNRAAHGSDHQDTLSALGNLATALKAQGKLAEAEPLMRETLERRRKLLGEDHSHTLVAMSELEVLLQAQGKVAEAEPICRAVLAKQIKAFGYENLDTLISVNSLGGLLLKQAKDIPSPAKYKEALDVMSPGESAAHTTLKGTPRLHRYLLNLGKARSGTGDFAGAEKNLLDARARSAKMRGESHKDTKSCDEAIVLMYEEWEKAEPGAGKKEKAAEWKARLSTQQPVGEHGKK
ncbi:MAG: tetratricopeptide repeat protein [Phycisphaerales bacterium]|nr:tetratricopeptide repeat protein [Planctomycetota bacterium]